MYPPVLTPELLSIAKSCKIYVLGSDELFRLHVDIRPFGTFVSDRWYVVYHPGVRGASSFHTLNHGIVGQTATMMFDLPANWNH